jgi:asparagine synthase (glutamine-hydrolysing)
MCGISGILSFGGSGDLRQPITSMVKSQSHRGPDGNGVWQGAHGEQHIALGHNRLAIFDLSEAGQQPFHSADKRHILVYNGELYNFPEIRAELRSLGVIFRTQTDTEVVLNALITWGAERALRRFNGMWAFAWLDRGKATLTLSRDRVGEKPLYYYRGASAFYFGSEIKAILAGTNERFRVNLPVVARYIRQSLLDAQDETFFDGICALPAAHNLTLDLSGLPEVPTPRIERYWSPPMRDQFLGNVEDRIEAVRETFMDSVRIRLRSDVPVGVMLSGGLGSSSITAAMRAVLGRESELNIISAVSTDPRFNEERYIDLMTEHLQTRSHKFLWRPSGEQALKLLESVTYFNDEPVGDFSIAIHHLLMQLSRELGLTVILSGQGDDELLCGYKKYLGFYLHDLVRRGEVSRAVHVLAQFLSRRTVVSQFSLSEAKHYLPRFLRGRSIVTDGPVLRAVESSVDIGLGSGGVIGRQCADITRFSVPTQVHYEDRMSMGCSREVRLPFLDYRMIELLLPWSPEWKLRDGWSKWIFRKALESLLPPSVVWRKDKLGFANPQSVWLKREFKPAIDAFLAGDLLSEQCGLIDRAAVRRVYADFCNTSASSSAGRFQDFLHPIALEMWLRKFESSLALRAQDWAKVNARPAARAAVTAQ